MYNAKIFLEKQKSCPPTKHTPFKLIISDLTTYSVSAICCRYTQFWLGNATTRACFSLVMAINWRSLNESAPLSVGLMRFVFFVGVPVQRENGYNVSKIYSHNQPLPPPRLSSFHASYEYGIRAPLQSRNDIDKIEPFRRNIGPPICLNEKFD